MNRANEIYGFDRSIKKLIAKLESSLNGDTIIRYHWHRVAEGLSLARQFKCMRTLGWLSDMLGKRFEQAAKDDIVKLIARVEQRQLSAWTKYDYKVILKKFYQWLFDCDRGQYPDIVRWVRAGSSIPNGLKKSDLLTTDEIRKLVDAALTIRDKAMILVLAESGRRPSEILTLRIGDVEFDSMGARLRVHGKMGEGYSRVMSSSPMLATWLDVHPVRHDKEAPVWITQDGRRPRQLKYHSARGMLLDCIKRAGLSKRVWFRLFRHTTGTSASTKLNAQQLCAFMGWKQGSNMPSVYVHLAGEDIDQAQAIMNGVGVEKEQESMLKPLICPRCNHINSSTSKLCNRCGFAFDVKTAIEMDSVKDRIHAIIEKMMADPAKLEMVMAALG